VYVQILFKKQDSKIKAFKTPLQYRTASEDAKSGPRCDSEIKRDDIILEKERCAIE
jgi:hypothetical protein